MLATTFIHHWWGVLEPIAIRLFPPGESKVKHVLFKVAADQGFGGVCYNTIFFGVQGTVKAVKGKEGAMVVGEIADNVRYEINNNLSPQLMNHWSFWPFFHTLNFWFNGLHQRVVWQNLASIGWGVVLSRVGEENRRKEIKGRGKGGGNPERVKLGDLEN